MKKTLKKTLALALAILSVFVLSLTAFAAVTLDDAKAIALKDAGYSADQVKALYGHVDYEGTAKIWDVTFYVENADGSYLEFSYEIKEADGVIIDKDVDIERLPIIGGGSDADIGLEAAKQIAVAEFNFALTDVEFLEVNKENDDGVIVYDINFHRDFEAKYSVEVVAADGTVVDREEDICNTLGDKIELFFEVIFFKIFSLFSK